jgi:hypothetical protein
MFIPDQTQQNGNDGFLIWNRYRSTVVPEFLKWVLGNFWKPIYTGNKSLQPLLAYDTQMESILTWNPLCQLAAAASELPGKKSVTNV